MGAECEHPHAKVGATEDISANGDIVAVEALTIEELCTEHHLAHSKGVATINVLVEHIPTSTDNSRSNDKGSYEAIFTITQIGRTIVYIVML